MKIDFGAMPDIKTEGMHGGAGEVTARVYEDSERKVVPCRIHPGASIGLHRHDDGEEIIYVLYGNGVAVCDGVEEILATDVCHICPKGAEHSIRNTGVVDLVMLTVEMKK